MSRTKGRVFEGKLLVSARLPDNEEIPHYV